MAGGGERGSESAVSTPEWQALVTKIRSLISLGQRLLPNYKKMGQAKFNAENAQARIDTLDHIWTQCRELHVEVEVQVPATERQKCSYLVDEEFAKADAEFWEAKDFLLEVIHSFSDPVAGGAAATAAASSSGAARSRAKLPRLDLPRFSGEYQEWQAFRDLFTSLVIKDAVLDDVERLQYLKTSLEGSALKVIAHYTTTDANFVTAWAALTRRFDNKRALVATHVRALITMPPMSDDSAAELTRVCDTTNRSLSLLANLGCPTTQWDALVVGQVCLKLESGLLEEWEKSLGTTTEPPTYDELDRFLESRIRSREATQAHEEAKVRARGEAPKSSKSAPSSKSTTSSNARVCATNAASEPLRAASKSQCPMCRARHAAYRCNAFRALQPEQRRDFANTKRLCYNCLAPGHMAPSCPVTAACSRCGRRHHSLLHTASADAGADVPPTPAPAAPAPSTVGGAAPANATLHACVTSGAPDVGPVLLATAIVRAGSAGGGDATDIRVLLDQGAQTSLISESIVQTLRLPRQPTRTYLTGALDGKLGISRAQVRLSLTPHHGDRPAITIKAKVVPRVSSYLPEWSSFPQSQVSFAGLPLADPEPSTRRPVDLIIGADYFGALLLPGLRRGSPSALIAQETIFGWIVSGPTGRPPSASAVNHIATETVADDDRLHELLQRFWELEETRAPASLSPDDERCEQHFRETHLRQADGRYVVRLPLKDGPLLDVGASLPRATAMLRSLDRRLARDATLEAKYRAFLREYEDLGHMEEVVPGPDCDPPATRVYLPHHPVVREADGKLRVVFNASSPTSNGTSLNDHLLIGPKLQQDIVTILLRWRLPRFALKADIEKMYRQIRVHPSDAELQCVLWHRCPEAVPSTFRLQTVTYGTAVAPYLAQRVLQQLAIDEGGEYPRGRRLLGSNFYVDDVLFGSDEVASALAERDELCALLARGGFTLRKWAANHPALSPEDVPCAAEASPVPSAPDGPESCAVLGIQWAPQEDAFHYRIAPPSAPATTKRTVLSVAARLYDPLGWISPAVVVAKIMLQDLWLRGTEWDVPLPSDLLEKWRIHIAALPLLESARIPRWCGLDASTVGCELHGFADASSRAYAAVVYARVVRRGQIGAHVTLLVAKTRVAPVKTVSIPRLELCAAALLARLLQRVASEAPWPSAALHAWTDSRVVLSWLQRHPSHWKVFVANRVAEIQSLIPAATWRHVPTLDNPADCASRGMHPRDLLRHDLWWGGPLWLSGAPSEWPASAEPDNSRPMEEEARTAAAHVVAAPLPSPLDPLPYSCSSWPRLLRVTARIQRLGRRGGGGDSGNADSRVPELRGARVWWIRWLQGTVFVEDIAAIKKGVPVRRSSPLRQLTPFVDDDGLVRVGGRLSHALLPYDARHPIVLPEHHISRLIIAHAHLRALHGGPQLTLSVLRGNFWVLRARDLVRATVHRCTVCVRHRATTGKQIMADLPAARVSPSRPFDQTGVDYAGPIMTRPGKGRGYRAHKAYIALFVCLSTRAVHLELVTDYTSASFLAAFQRFVSRRGRPSRMHSDNGTTFKGAARDLGAAIRGAVESPEVAAFTGAEEIQWSFIPPAAPHFGGLWEAGVKSAKHHLHRVVHDHTLSYEEMTTVLCMVEACLNSRPLGPAPAEDDDFALTPGHFLTGAPLLALPPMASSSGPASLRGRWQLVQRMRDHFWRRWQADYLNTLQPRRKWTSAQRSLCVGDVVVLKGDDSPPAQWRLGRVSQVHPGPDGRVRVVSVHTAHGDVIRPITRVVLLPRVSEADESRVAT